jgi:hypothetical protein
MPQVVTDDPVYRVNNIWLGPEKMTWPWRWTYAQWGVAIVLFLLTFATLRLWFHVSFFTLAWAAVITVVLTRFVGKKLTHERDLFATSMMLVHEVQAPRKKTAPIGGAAAVGALRISQDRPRPIPKNVQSAPPATRPGVRAVNPWEAHRG